MAMSSLYILPNICFCVPQNKETHKDDIPILAEYSY